MVGRIELDGDCTVLGIDVIGRHSTMLIRATPDDTVGEVGEPEQFDGRRLDMERCVFSKPMAEDLDPHFEASTLDSSDDRELRVIADRITRRLASFVEVRETPTPRALADVEDGAITGVS
jgi:hypothetical protein